MSEVKLHCAQWEPWYFHETATKPQRVRLAEPSLHLEQTAGLRGLSKARQSCLTELADLDLGASPGLRHSPAREHPTRKGKAPGSLVPLRFYGFVCETWTSSADRLCGHTPRLCSMAPVCVDMTHGYALWTCSVGIVQSYEPLLCSVGMFCGFNP